MSLRNRARRASIECDRGLGGFRLREDVLRGLLKSPSELVRVGCLQEQAAALQSGIRSQRVVFNLVIGETDGISPDILSIFLIRAQINVV